MAPRRKLGSWLEGTPGDASPTERRDPRASGRGPVAGTGRRLVALCVDWLLSLAVSGAFFPVEDVPRGVLAGEPLATLAVFGLSTLVLVGLLGHTIGHRLLRLRVLRWDDVTGHQARSSSPRVRPPGLVRALVRTALLCLVIPAVVWDSSGRGLHDVAAGTAIVRH